jgi:hypothetical protein
MNYVNNGSEYIANAASMEEQCEHITDHSWSLHGVKAPLCETQLNEVVFRLDAVSCCHWGCHGGDHTIEYIAGKITSSARASLRLLRMGFYDESLGITRSIGEATNLLQLFAIDKEKLQEWLALDESSRMKKYSPAKVRLTLEQAGSHVPMNRETYALLSGISAHTTPDTHPNSYLAGERPTSGGHYNPIAALACLNELGFAAAMATLSLNAILDLPKEIKIANLTEAKQLIANVGKLRMTSLNELQNANKLQ